MSGLPHPDDAPSTRYLDHTHRPVILPRPDCPYPYASQRPSRLKIVTSSDDLPPDTPEDLSELQQTSQHEPARQNRRDKELEEDVGPGSTEGAEKGQRKDSRFEQEEEKDAGEREHTIDVRQSITSTDQSREVQGESSDSDVTIRSSSPTIQDFGAEENDSDESDIVERTSTSFEPQWSQTLPLRTLSERSSTDRFLNVEPLDRDRPDPIRPPNEELEMTTEHIEIVPSETKLERNDTQLVCRTRPGLSGEAPAPGEWFSRPLSLQANSTTYLPRWTEMAAWQGDIEGSTLLENAGGTSKSEQTQETPEPGVWLGGQRSGGKSSSSVESMQPPPTPKVSVKKPRKGQEEGRAKKSSIKFEEPSESPSGQRLQASRRREETEQSTKAVERARIRFGNAAKELGAYHRRREYNRRSFRKERRQQVPQSTLGLERKLEEDSEAIADDDAEGDNEDDEDEDDDDNEDEEQTEGLSLGTIGDDLNFERRRFSRKSCWSSVPLSFESRAEAKRRHHEEGSASERDASRFPGMEEVWRRVGLGPSVDMLMRTGQWSSMEAQWNSFQDYDFMWEFKEYWDRMLEDGNVSFTDFMGVWKRAMRIMAGQGEGGGGGEGDGGGEGEGKGGGVGRDGNEGESEGGQGLSADQDVPNIALDYDYDPDLDLDLDLSTPNYRNQDPNEAGESVYLDQHFRHAVIQNPGVDPDTNDWTKRFFAVHSYVASPQPAPEIYGPGDRKGKRPANRGLRGGHDIPPLFTRASRRRCHRYSRFHFPRRSPSKIHRLKSLAMNNYFNSADMANSVPRQAPSPGPPHQTNGIGANSMANLNNSVLPAGQQADMNHLWGVVEQLSQVLAENRVQTAGIVSSVQQIQVRSPTLYPEHSSHHPVILLTQPLQSRAAANGTSPTVASLNHDLQHSSAVAQLQNSTTSPPLPTGTSASQQISQLTRELTQLQQSHASLAHSHTSLLTLLTQHETLLDTAILPQLRRYAHAHTLALTSLHAHYQRLLEEERAANLALRLEHQKWQEGLGRVSRWARLALRENGEEEGRRKQRERLGRLREENRVLRNLVGWEERGDESEEEGESRAEDEVGQNTGVGD